MCAAALHFSERNPSNPQIKKGSVVMATPIYTGLDNGLKPKMASVSLLKEQSRHIVFLHPVQRQGEEKFNGKKMVAQAFVKQIKNDGRVSFGNSCVVSLGSSEGHADNFCCFFSV
jgi:hypothetical protein